MWFPNRSPAHLHIAIAANASTKAKTTQATPAIIPALRSSDSSPFDDATEEDDDDDDENASLAASQSGPSLIRCESENSPR